MVFNQVVTIHDGLKIPVSMSLYFQSQNDQSLFPHLCAQWCTKHFPCILCLSALNSPMYNTHYCLTDVKTVAEWDQVTHSEYPCLSLTLGSTPQNTKLLMALRSSYICLLGTVVHEYIISQMLGVFVFVFLLVEAALMWSCFPSFGMIWVRDKAV